MVEESIAGRNYRKISITRTESLLRTPLEVFLLGLVDLLPQ